MSSNNDFEGGEKAPQRSSQEDPGSDRSPATSIHTPAEAADYQSVLDLNSVAGTAISMMQDSFVSERSILKDALPQGSSR